MSYLGDFQLGDRLPLSAFCAAGSGLPVSPDAAPVATFYEAAGTTPLLSAALPPADRTDAPGLFALAFHLDARFAPGCYTVLLTWLVSGSARAGLARFTVLPGGHADGAVIAMHAYRRPHADFLVQQGDSGKLLKGRNPTV